MHADDMPLTIGRKSGRRGRKAVASNVFLANLLFRPQGSEDGRRRSGEAEGGERGRSLSSPLRGQKACDSPYGRAVLPSEAIAVAEAILCAKQFTST